MELELSSVFYADFSITAPGFFFSYVNAHRTCTSRTSKRVLCNCHEVSKVSSGGRLVPFCMGNVGEVVENL